MYLINLSRVGQSLRLGVLDAMVVLLSPNFSLMPKPQFEKTVTLEFSHGKFLYMAQKWNQTQGLAQKHHHEYEYLNKNAKICLNRVIWFQNFGGTVLLMDTSSRSFDWCYELGCVQNLFRMLLGKKLRLKTVQLWFQIWLIWLIFQIVQWLFSAAYGILWLGFDSVMIMEWN